MRKKHKILGIVLLALVAVGAFGLALSSSTFAVLDPAGSIAEEQKKLIVFATVLSLVIILPVFALTFGIVWRYRESNTKSRYTPDWDHSRLAESIWWGVPVAVIAVLGVVIWQSSYALDPSRPIASSRQPLEVQVIALNWKWLFIYPEQNIASVNFLHLPVDRPVSFKITADAPINSFWIPQLGGQIYAMPGIETNLNLMASTPGDYRGSSANLSGKGFDGMRFIARASSDTDFNSWISTVKQTAAPLDKKEYARLFPNSRNEPSRQYAPADPLIFSSVIARYVEAGRYE